MGQSPPTKKSYEKFFKNDRNAWMLFLASARMQIKSKPWVFIGTQVAAIILALMYIMLLDKKILRYETLSSLNNVVLSFSSTFLGVMTIAFSLLVTFANKKLSMWLYCAVDNNYAMPPIRFMLLFFCYPISLMLLLVLTSLMIHFVSHLTVDVTSLCDLMPTQLNLIDLDRVQIVINSISLFVVVWLSALASLELPSFISNIYKFMVVYFGKFSEIQENEIIHKIADKKPLDDYERIFEEGILRSVDDLDEPVE